MKHTFYIHFQTKTTSRRHEVRMCSIVNGDLQYHSLQTVLCLVGRRRDGLKLSPTFCGIQLLPDSFRCRLRTFLFVKNQCICSTAGVTATCSTDVYFTYLLPS